MNIKSLKPALKAALLAEFNSDQTINPAIVFDGGKFLYESAIHGSKVVIDLQEDCGAFSLLGIKAEDSGFDELAEIAAGQWLDWCAGQVIEEIDAQH